MRTGRLRRGGCCAFPRKRVLVSLLLLAGYAVCFQSLPLVSGVVTGGLLATGNFLLMQFLVERILYSDERQGRIYKLFQCLFFFKFLVVGLLLFGLARTGLVDLTGVIGGFTVVILVVLYKYFLMLKEGNEFNGTSASLY